MAESRHPSYTSVKYHLTGVRYTLSGGLVHKKKTFWSNQSFSVSTNSISKLNSRRASIVRISA